MTMKKFIILMFILIFMRPHEILWDLTNISVEISIKPHLDLVWDLMRSHENLRWDLLHILIWDLIWDLMRSYWDHMRFSSHEISMRSQMRFSHGILKKSFSFRLFTYQCFCWLTKWLKEIKVYKTKKNMNSENILDFYNIV